MAYLNWVWRWFGTAVGFFIFGLFGLLFKIVLLPYTWQAERNTLKEQLKARYLVGTIWAIFVRYLGLTGVATVSYHGFDRLGKPGQLILVNHPSLLDVVFILSKVRNLNCIVKKDLLQNPVMKSPILACGFIPNDQSLEMVEQCDQLLKEGQTLLIFPEGTRTGWDGKISFNRGPVSIGLRSAKVITPVVIKMSAPNFKKGQPWWKVPKQKLHYDFMVGEDIYPEDWLREKPLPIAARKLNEELQLYFQRETSK